MAEFLAKTAFDDIITSLETLETNVETIYDNFDDRYLGAKSSDPTVDNDGNALLTGALYFNSTDNVLKIYSGSEWLNLWGNGFQFDGVATTEANLPAPPAEGDGAIYYIQDTNEKGVYNSGTTSWTVTGLGASVTGGNTWSGVQDFTGRIDADAGISFDGGTNVMSDYEEGTWTPDVQTSGAGTSATLSTADGNYVRIGNIVFADFEIVATSLNSGTGAIQIHGLPIAPASTTGSGAISKGGNLNITAGQIVAVRPNIGSYLDAFLWDGTGGTSQLISTEFTDTGELTGSVMYIV